MNPYRSPSASRINTGRCSYCAAVACVLFTLHALADGRRNTLLYHDREFFFLRTPRCFHFAFFLTSPPEVPYSGPAPSEMLNRQNIWCFTLCVSCSTTKTVKYVFRILKIRCVSRVVSISKFFIFGPWRLLWYA